MTPRLQTAAGLVVYVVTIAAFLVLTLSGHEDNTTELLGLAGPVVAALLINARLTPIAAGVSKIDEQTNGVLDTRIEQGVRRGLLAHSQATANTVRLNDSSDNAT